MPIKLTKCSSCDYTGKHLYKNNEDKFCPKCGTILLIDNLGSVKKGVSFERVPGGYDYVKLTNRMNSEDGIYKQAAFFSGESNSAY